VIDTKAEDFQWVMVRVQVWVRGCPLFKYIKGWWLCQ
jgi:hypothetical protein